MKRKNKSKLLVNKLIVRIKNIFTIRVLFLIIIFLISSYGLWEVIKYGLIETKYFEVFLTGLFIGRLFNFIVFKLNK